MKAIILSILLSICGNSQCEEILKLRNDRRIKGNLTGEYKPATVEFKTSSGTVWLKFSELQINDRLQFSDDAFTELYEKSKARLAVLQEENEKLKKQVAGHDEQLRRLQDANEKLKNLVSEMNKHLEKYTAAESKKAADRRAKVIATFEGNGDKTFNPFEADGPFTVKWTLKGNMKSFHVRVYRDGQEFSAASAESTKSGDTWVKAPNTKTFHWLDVTQIGDGGSYTIEVIKWNP